MLVVVGARLQGLGTTAYAVTAFLLWPEMEKIMSKTNETSYEAVAKSERELTEDELDAVSGGSGSRAFEIKDWSFGSNGLVS
jgi:bacteriocin-like protein